MIHHLFAKIVVAYSLLVLPCCTGNKHDVEQCVPGQGLTLPTRQIPSRGNPAAAIKVTIFGDITCPITQKLIVSLDGYLQRDGADSVELFYRHLLRSTSPPSIDTARALAAANLQGNEYFWSLFWRLLIMEDFSFDSVSAAGEATVPDPSAYRNDIASDDVNNVVLRDIALGQEIGFDGVPGVILCGKKTVGTPSEVIENIEYLVRQQSSVVSK